MYNLSEKVWWFAVFSRLFVLIVSALSNHLIPDHDAGVFISPSDPLDTRKSLADDVVEHLFSGLVRWDAQYFLHIAKYGYTYENCLAYFPLFPLLVRYLSSTLFCFLSPVFTYHSVTVLSAVFINFIAFVHSAVLLFRLGLCVLKHDGLAYKAAILYCVNPASIFFSAPYSETLFALFAFYGMLKCVKTKGGEEFSLQCGILFGLSAVCRSNGLLNFGFVVYEKLIIFLQFIHTDLIRKYNLLRNNSVLVLPLLIFPFSLSIISFMFTTLLSLIPFIGFQRYSYDKFCTGHEHNLPLFITTFAGANKFILPGTKHNTTAHHWCSSSIPFAYTYVQQHYWDVGFLKYYHWKQIPNFILAFPVTIIILFYSVQYLYEKWQWWSFSEYILRHPNITKKKHNGVKSILPMEIFPFVIHIVFLTCFCVTCIHVQVTTRMVASASPVLYWFAACLFPNTGGNSPSDRLADQFKRNSRSVSSEQFRPEDVETVNNLSSRWKVFIVSQSFLSTTVRMVRMYFLLYLLIGTVLFSNFYPWT